MEAGGGSGGSIWVETSTLDGDGTIDVSGGAGYGGPHAPHGGGGGAGRLAVYYKWNHYVGQSQVKLPTFPWRILLASFYYCSYIISLAVGLFLQIKWHLKRVSNEGVLCNSHQ